MYTTNNSDNQVTFGNFLSYTCFYTNNDVSLYNSDFCPVKYGKNIFSTTFLKTYCFNIVALPLSWNRSIMSLTHETYNWQNMTF